MHDLQAIYLLHKIKFDERLETFRSLWINGSDLDIFAELCYCLCTPREKAANALIAVDELCRQNMLGSGSIEAVDGILLNSGIALHPQKAGRIIKNRGLFYPDTKNKLNAQALCGRTIFKSREALIDLVTGFGYKEASHFLRNIGFGGKLCILDRHIINQLIRYKIIDNQKYNLTGKKYIEIENTMTRFAEKEGIPLDALDLVLMYQETPDVLK
jgi:N-glycosylase/DNA lyase